MSRHTIARMHQGAVQHNLRRVRELAPDSAVVAVVKADAYGHGTAIVRSGLADADLLAVATVGELQDLRAHGWTGRLLLLEGFSGVEEYQQVLAAGAEFVVHHESQLALLRQRPQTDALPIWLKIDTGMNRLGFQAQELATLTAEIRQLNQGRTPVLMSHFACADDPENPMTSRQLRCFQDARADISGAVSLANSAAVISAPASHGDYIRPGIMLYGISPMLGEQGSDRDLLPVMTLSCRLLAVNQAKAGASIGYGARYHCAQDMRVGVAGIGYGDGYPRSMPDGTPVLVNGRRASLAGRVSMDMITLDLSDHPDAQVGDEVVLWGDGLPVEEVARGAGLIPWELVCGVTGRVRRELV